MSDRPPVVDFRTPYDPLQHLATQRQRLRGLVVDIERSLADVRNFESEGSRDATLAFVMAATITLTDILKISVSAVDRRAKLLFNKQDEALAQANKVLKFFGYRTMTTKAELMRSVDPSLGGAAKLTQGVRDAQKVLKEYGLKAPKDMTLLLNFGTTVCDDTMLMISSGLTAQAVKSNAARAQAMMRLHLQKVKQRLMLIEMEFTRLFEDRQRLARTA